MVYSLILQSDYNNVSVALCKDSVLLEVSIDTKHKASINLVSQMNGLLKNQNLAWSDIAFIGLNQGPAPFTTLRVIITTANGLNFAHKIPLVGVDGIKTFLEEQKQSTPLTIVLLNAFAKDVYFGIKKDDQIIATGWENHKVFLESVRKDYINTPITFVGNGALLYEKEIKGIFGDYATMPTPFQDYCSIESIITQSYKQWEKKENVADMLLPLYLKTQEYKTAM